MSKMKAERELDALVAEKVMGKTLGQGFASIIVDGPFEDCSCPSHDEAGALPHYSTSIADAWMVVEYFKARQCRVELFGEDGYDWSYWTCKIIHPVGTDVLGEATVEKYHEPVAPEAICLAALKAVEIKYVS